MTITKNNSLIDILCQINIIFNNTSINRKDYPERDDVVKLKEVCNELKERVEIVGEIVKSAVIEQATNNPIEFQKKAIEAGISIQTAYGPETNGLSAKKKSVSRIITKPLRKIKSWIKRVFGKKGRRKS